MLSKKKRLKKFRNFSVIFSVYYGERLKYFIKAFESIENQTLKPKQIVVVIDGKLKKNLYSYLLVLKKRKKILLIKNSINRGQSYARHIAIKNTKYSIVAVMDSDDVSDPKRFEIQINCLKKNKLDIVGCNIGEFSKSSSKIERHRNVPEFQNDMYRFSNWRSPMNGATLVFKKSSYFKSKGYPLEMNKYEDYILILRFFQKGFKCYNIQDILYFARINKNWIQRRSGIDYIKSEIKLSNYLYKNNFINFISFVFQILLRITIRILPNQIISFIYNNHLRKKPK